MDAILLIIALLILSGVSVKYNSGGETRLRLGPSDDDDEDGDDVEDDDEEEDEEEVLDRQAALEVITSRLEAAGFRVVKEEDSGEPGEVGCLQINLTRRWCCSNCEGEHYLHELHEYALLEPPTKTSPMVAGWKRLGWVCIHCGHFSRTKRCFAGGILGQLLPNSGNIREMLVALRESELDITARIKAIIEAQKEFWRRRLEAVEKANQKLLGSPGNKNGKKNG